MTTIILRIEVPDNLTLDFDDIRGRDHCVPANRIKLNVTEIHVPSDEEIEIKANDLYYNSDNTTHQQDLIDMANWLKSKILGE